MKARAVLVSCVLGAGCGSPHGGRLSGPLTSRVVAGCYTLTWERADSALRDRSFFPDLVQLRLSPSCPSCASDAPAARYLALGSPLPDTASANPGQPIPWHRRYYASWWEIHSPDTVTIVFNSNYDGWQLQLSPANGALRGPARYWSDGGIASSAAVVAISASCGIAA